MTAPAGNRNATRLRAAQAALAAGRLQEAEQITRPLLDVPAHFIEARLMLLRVLIAADRAGEALPLLEAVLEKAPTNARLLGLAGETALAAEDHVTALGYLQKALEADPGEPRHWEKLIDVMAGVGAREEALALSEHMLAQLPDHPRAHAKRGALLVAAGRNEAALAACRRAVELAPQESEWHIRLLGLMSESGDMAGIIAHAEEHGEAVLGYQGRLYLLNARITSMHYEAAERLGQALEGEAPQNVAVKSLMSLLMLRLGRFHEAIAWADQAVALEPDNAPARWHRALAHQALGELGKAHADFDARFGCDSGAKLRPFLNRPLWQGEALEGRRLLLWSDQGIGDLFKFMPLIRETAARADDLVIEVDPKAHALLRWLVPQAEVRATPSDKLEGLFAQQANRQNDYDLHCPLADLQRIHCDAVADVHRFADICRAPEERLAAVRDLPLFRDSSRPKVGLFWRSKNWQSFHAGSTPGFEAMLEVLGRDDVDFVSLQYGLDEEQLSGLCREHGVRIHTVAEVDLFDDLLGAMALAQCLDFVISANSTMADIAGRVGVPSLRYGAAMSPACMGEARVPWYAKQDYLALAHDAEVGETARRLRAWLDARLA